MRLPIRWKIAASAALPLILVAVAVGAMVYRALHLRSTEEFETRSLRLNEAIAARLDAELARAAQVARCTAAFVAANPDLTRAQIERTLDAAVRQEPLIFGAAVAFEPHAFDPAIRLAAPYAVRRGGDIRLMDIGADSYDYTDPSWEWYRVPRESRAAAWTEPYYDAGAGDAMMCTFGVPIERGGRLVGVATVDVPVAELQSRLATGIRDAESLFIVSRRGTFVSAPDPTLVRNRTLKALVDERDDDNLRRLNQMLLAGRRGIVQADAILPGPNGAEPTWYFFGPLATTGWSLAVTVPARAMPSEEERGFQDSVPTLALGLLAVTGCVWVAARRFTRPIDQLTHAVKSMAGAVGGGAGDLAAVIVPRVRSRDEVGDLAESVEATLAELRTRIPALVEERLEANVEMEVARRLADEAQRSARRLVGPAATERESPRGAQTSDDGERKPYALRRRGASPGDDPGQLADAVVRRDGRLVLVTLAAEGGGIAASAAAHSIRALLRGLASATDDPGRLLAETARLAGGLERRVSAAVAVYVPETGEVALALAGRAAAWHGVPEGGAERVGRAGPALGRTAPAGAHETCEVTCVRLAVGDRLTLAADESAAGADGPSGAVVAWTLERRREA